MINEMECCVWVCVCNKRSAYESVNNLFLPLKKKIGFGVSFFHPLFHSAFRFFCSFGSCSSRVGSSLFMSFVDSVFTACFRLNRKKTTFWHIDTNTKSFQSPVEQFGIVKRPPHVLFSRVNNSRRTEKWWINGNVGERDREKIYYKISVN